mgnify:CR=1 FL=1
MDAPSETELDTYACSEVRAIRLSKLCTSLLIGYYIKDLDDFSKFFEQLDALALIDHSIITVYDKKPTKDQVLVDLTQSKTVKIAKSDGAEGAEGEDDDDDDFELF